LTTSRGTTLVARAWMQMPSPFVRRASRSCAISGAPGETYSQAVSSFSLSAPRRVSAGTSTASHRPAALCKSAVCLLLLFIAFPIWTCRHYGSNRCI